MSHSLTTAEHAALVWLNKRNGSGVFGISKKGVDSSSNVLLAAGDRAPVMRGTWNALRDKGMVKIEAKRVTVTEAGAHPDFHHKRPDSRHRENRGKSYGLSDPNSCGDFSIEDLVDEGEEPEEELQ